MPDTDTEGDRAFWRDDVDFRGFFDAGADAVAVAVDFLDVALDLVVFGADADASAVVDSRRLGGLKGRRLRFWTVF